MVKRHHCFYREMCEVLWEHLGRAPICTWKVKDKLLGKVTPGEVEERGILGREWLKGENTAR